MRDVNISLFAIRKITAYKFIHDLPLEDKQREEFMLTEVAEKAKTMNICEKTLCSFFLRW